ncbi:MAG: Hsp20 family protein [Gemmatimonadota bacterium]
MSHVQIQRDTDGARTLPVFREIEERLETVRQRAFHHCATRGGEPGHELDDWIAAEREVMGWPAAELKERNGAYEVEVTLPGFTPKEIEVTATPNELIVHAVTATDRPADEGRVIWSEFGRNEVYRRFDLPTEINADRITAKLDHGILHVMAPKSILPIVLTPPPGQPDAATLAHRVERRS